MQPQISNAQSHQNRAITLRSIDLSKIDSLQPERSRPAGSPVGSPVTMSLIHLDVALAVEVHERKTGDATDGASCFKVSAKRLARNTEAAVETRAAEKFDDPVIRRLADALAATEAAHDSHSAICADALRLAIVTRQFSVQRPLTGVSADGVTEDTTGRNARSLQKWRLNRVLQYVDDNLAAKLTLQDLALVAGLSRMHFAAQFRAAVGMRPHEYLLKRRVERAEELLKKAEVPVVEVALTVGFQTQAHFTTVFKRFAGDTPYQWRCAYLAQATPLPAARRRPS
jgi:AraC family transcriptional regulator